MSTRRADKLRHNDPGLGSSGLYTQRAINKDGSFNVRRKGLVRGTRDFYQYLIRISWFPFLLGTFLTYTLMNILFALGYVLIGTSQLSMQGEDGLTDFLNAFYFSCQTFTTVGYGFIAPIGHGAALLASFEALAGLTFFSLVTGLVYGRFSKPVSRLTFSQTAVVAPYRGITALQFRVANGRNSEMMDMDATVMLIQYQKQNGELKRVYTRLALEMDHISFLPLSWTVVHPIQADSPLYGKTMEDLIAEHAEVLVLMKGFDENYGREVHARYSYLADEIEFGKRFVIAYNAGKDGMIEIDVNNIHRTEEAPLP